MFAVANVASILPIHGHHLVQISCLGMESCSIPYFAPCKNRDTKVWIDASTSETSGAEMNCSEEEPATHSSYPRHRHQQQPVLKEIIIV